MQTIEKIVKSSTPPDKSNVLWLKQSDEGEMLMSHNNGTWESLSGGGSSNSAIKLTGSIESVDKTTFLFTPDAVNELSEDDLKTFYVNLYNSFIDGKDIIIEWSSGGGVESVEVSEAPVVDATSTTSHIRKIVSARKISRSGQIEMLLFAAKELDPYEVILIDYVDGLGQVFQ